MVLGEIRVARDGEKVARLGEVAPFDTLPAAAVRELERACTPREFGRGQVILREGAPRLCAFLIERGTVKVTTLFPDGREAVLFLLGPGELLFESPGPNEEPWGARAMQPTRALAVPVARLWGAVSASPRAAVVLARLLTDRMDHLARSLAEALFLDVPTRLARLLWRLARAHGVRLAGGLEIQIPLTQEDLAQMVGCSRETVNRCLAQFAAAGLIAVGHRRLVLTDPSGLTARAALHPA